jgi:hypothetical protein
VTGTDPAGARSLGMRRPLFVASLALLLLAAGAVTYAVARGDAPAASDRRLVPAPIDAMSVAVRAADQHVILSVRAGLLGGCAKQDSHAVSRAGDVVTVTVNISIPATETVCTMIYGTYDLQLDLGTDFKTGSTYTIRVNDQKQTFTR